jgi:cytochrome c peroxidase
VNHYNAIPAVVPGLDNRLRQPGPGGGQPQRLDLSEQEKADLVDFLETLTGSSIYTDEKYSTPFNTDGSLGLVILPTDNAQMSFSEQDGTQYVTLRSSGVPNVGYFFQTSSDLDQWSSTSITASAAGELEMDVPLVDGEDQMFYRFAYGVTVD